MKRIFGLAPNAFLLGLVSLFNDFSSEMIYAVMPAFLTSVIGVPALSLGLLEGFADAIASVLKIFSGWLSDKTRGRKALAVFGYGLSTATRFFLYLVTGFGQVFALRAIDRVGKGLRDSPRDALLAESVPPGEIGRSFGYHRAMDTVGGVLGPLAAVVLLPLLAYNYQNLFLIGFLAGAAGLLTFIFVRDVRQAGDLKSKRAGALNFSLKGFDRPFKLFLLSMFVFSMGVMPITLVLLKARDAGFDGGAIPFMYLVYSVSFALFAIPFGRASDRLGERRVIVWGFIAAIAAYVVFVSARGASEIVIGFILFGLYSAMTDGVGRALAAKLVAPEKLATGQGLLQAAIGFASLFAGAIGGAIWTYAGSGPAFTFGAACMSAGLLLFSALSGKRSAV